MSPEALVRARGRAARDVAPLRTLSGVSLEPEVAALVEHAVAIANSILQGETDVYRGAKRLWVMQVELEGLQGLENDLRTFVGMASDWEDVPDQRKEIEHDIIRAADRFRARWGPSE